MADASTSSSPVLTDLLGGSRLDGGLLMPTQRGRMLDAITLVVAEKGYVATTVADVIARAGVSRKTFYEQFTDKEDCYLAAFRLGADYLISQLVGINEPGLDLAQRSSRLLARYLRTLSLSEPAARAFLVEVRAAGAAANERLSRIHDQFADLFSGGADTETDAGLAPMLRTGLIAALNDLVSREILAGRAAELPALEPKFTELAVRILRPRPAGAGSYPKISPPST